MNIYSERPRLWETTKQFGGWLTSIHLEPRELTDEEREANGVQDTMTDEDGNEVRQPAWTATDVFYRHKKPLDYDVDYGKIVSAIVRVKYDFDDVEAIIQNFLDGNANGEHVSEWDDLQAWRAESKRIAKMLFNNTQ